MAVAVVVTAVVTLFFFVCHGRGTTTNMIQGLMWAWGAVGGVLLLLFAHNLVQYVYQ